MKVQLVMEDFCGGSFDFGCGRNDFIAFSVYQSMIVFCIQLVKEVYIKYPKNYSSVIWKYAKRFIILSRKCYTNHSTLQSSNRIIPVKTAVTRPVCLFDL